MVKPIVGKTFLEALGAAGIITADMRVRRVVIDAKIGDFVVMHVECYGDERLIEIVPALTGVEIRRIEQETEKAQ